MYKGCLVGVVIPAYNEEKFVADVIETVPEFVDHIYPVDDCSTDETWTEINRVTARVNTEEVEIRTNGGNNVDRIVPQRLNHNSGVGAAIKAGYKRAVADGMDVVAVMNGDGQMDPDILDRILDPVVEGQAGYVKGNRLLSAEHWAGMSGWRLFGNFLLTYLTRIASGYWQVTDPQNGYTAISADILDHMNLSSLHDDYGFLNDLLIQLNANDVPIADVEMRAVYGDEQSSIRYQSFIPKLLWLLLQRFLWRLGTKYLVREFRPFVVPYALGIVGGFVLVLYLPFLFVYHGVTDEHIGPIAAFTGCLVLVFIGIFFDRREAGGLETRIRK